MGPCYGVGHDDGGRMAGVQPPSYPADMALDQTEPRSGFCRFVRRAPARNRSACERKHGAGDNTVRRAIVARLQGPRPPRAGRSGKCPAFREPPHDPPRTDLRRPITLTCFWMLTLRDAHRHLHRVRPRRGPLEFGSPAAAGLQFSGAHSYRPVQRGLHRPPACPADPDQVSWLGLDPLRHRD
jgi:hypothetical protein